MDFDLSVYLGAFLDEVEEQLEILEKEVLSLEKDGENPDTIQNIFRSAHTLKGSSAAMGMEKMKELTHKVENVFDCIRNHQLKVNANIMNLIFESIDRIKDLKGAIINGTLDSVDISELVEKLDGIQSDGPSICLPEEREFAPQLKDTIFPEVILDEYQKDAVIRAIEMGMNVITVYVALKEETMLKSVRAFLIHNNLKEIGEIIASFPIPEIIEDEDRFEGSLAFIIVTGSDNKEVFQIINSISEIQTVHLTGITLQNLDSFSKGKKVEVAEKKM